MRVLITGATGYIGRRLKYRLQREKNLTIRLLMKQDKSSYPNDAVEVYTGNTFDIPSLHLALNGVDVAYYLVHAMDSPNYRERDRQSAHNFLEACIAQGVKRIIYLGGLGEKQSASEHLLSRIEVGEILSSRPDAVQTLWFRAGVIIGSGSASFEIIRHLVEKLPFMITPKWVNTLCQPSAQKDVIEYLSLAAFLEMRENAIIDIGSEVMSYKALLLGYAKAVGLRRTLIPVPFFSPKLSSYWLTLMTPVPYSIASALIEGLKSEVLVRNDNAQKLFPSIVPIPYAQAVELAIEEIKHEQIISRWSDASGHAWEVNHSDLANAIYSDRQIIPIHPNESASVYKMFCSVGGKKGWFGYDILWRIRGAIDKLFGGYGISRGRRDPVHLRIGDSVDFWKVVDLQEEKRLLLFAQMKLPGVAWLEFLIKDGNFYQTAYFYPYGLAGRLYWFALIPIHFFVFKGMANNLIRSVRKGVEDS
ncbi:MAG: SDR family oxidoreductase [Campylobacteraceae bacterium]|nr:SDR family oxidoreductase [Campylobacteraceae bacterium]